MHRGAERKAVPAAVLAVKTAIPDDACLTVDPPDDLRPLRFAPGASPFRVKGTVYRGHLEWVAQNCPGGLGGMNRAFRDPRLAPYFDQRFLPSSFYDMIPIVTSAYVVARLCRLPFDGFLRQRTRLQAISDLGGIYRLLLKLASPAQVVSRYAAVQAQYFEFGTASARLVDPQTAELERRQIPDMLLDWFVPVQEAFLEVGLAGAGARSLQVLTDPPEPDGEMHGVPSSRLITRVTWS